MAWAATISVTKHDSPEILIEVEANIKAGSNAEAKAAAQYIYDTIAGGKFRVLRCIPSSDDFTDPNTKITQHSGYVRFFFRDEPGEERKSPYNLRMVQHSKTPELTSVGDVRE